MSGMRSVEEHLTAALELAQPLDIVEVALADALGLALASDVRAEIALPPFDNSAMDGYAVRAADVVQVPVALPVAADIPAAPGSPAALAEGTAQRIMTGAPIPPGADAVVPVEQTDGGTQTVEIRESVAVATHVRRTGDDVAAGTVVLKAGDELTAARIGLLAAVGSGTCQVHRRPRVAVVSTGSELLAPGEPLVPGAIYDSNGPMLAALVEASGASVSAIQRCHDDIETFTRTLSEAAADADLVVTSGGISAGAYEVVKDSLSSRGLSFVKVAMQPGMPQGLGVVDGTPMLAMPGNPVSSFVSFELFVRPVLRRMMGHSVLHRPRHIAQLAEDVRRRPDKVAFVRGSYDATTGVVRLVGGRGSHLLASLAHSDALVVVPIGDGTLAAGSDVEVILTK